MQTPHPDLQSTRTHLLEIYNAISNFKPLTARPPILDSSLDSTVVNENAEENLNHWLQPESVPGLKKLKESIKLDLEVLEKFLDDPNCANLPPLSTNAPYLVAVWNELVCAPPPVISVFKTFQVSANGDTLTSSNKEKGRNEKEHQPSGVKVDIVADNGRRWIRVNTTKNSRMLSEFRELDSYLTDSSDSSDSEWDSAERPSLAQIEFDNSILRMGRSLLAAAQSNPLQGGSGTSDSVLYPKVTMRLTRLDPDVPNDDGTPPDPRITQTVDCLREMGVDVELGERTEVELAEKSPTSSSPDEAIQSNLPYIPTPNINLDLSVLIALISDLTHASLPQSIEEANRRFVPPQEYRDWKQKRLASLNSGKSKSQKSSDSKQSSSESLTSTSTSTVELETDINDLPRDLIKHARALTNQLLQEMGKGLLQEIHNRIQSSSFPYNLENGKPNVVFWTTSEARDRCLRIVSKIGGVHEKRRARALFCLAPGVTREEEIPLEEAKTLYWQDSRFPRNFVPLLPIRIFPVASPDEVGSLLVEIPRYPRSDFALSLGKVCADILAQEMVPHPRSHKSNISPPPSQTDQLHPQSKPQPEFHSEIQRASVTKANPRLTAHTVQSMQWGAELGWTTLTANRTSVKAILREVRGTRIARHTGAGGGGELAGGQGVGQGKGGGDRERFASIWIVDPRSLAEGMSSLPSARASAGGTG